MPTMDWGDLWDDGPIVSGGQGTISEIEQNELLRRRVPCLLAFCELVQLLVVFTLLQLSYLTLGDGAEDSKIHFDPWSITGIRIVVCAAATVVCLLSLKTRYFSGRITIVYLVLFGSICVLLWICMGVDAADYAKMVEAAESNKGAVGVYYSCHDKPVSGGATCTVAPVYMSVPVFGGFAGFFFFVTSVQLFRFHQRAFGSGFHRSNSVGELSQTPTGQASNRSDHSKLDDSDDNTGNDPHNPWA